jgi:hypothetical protein
MIMASAILTYYWSKLTDMPFLTMCMQTSNIQQGSVAASCKTWGYSPFLSTVIRFGRNELPNFTETCHVIWTSTNRHTCEAFHNL